MKAKDVRELSPKEIEKKLRESRDELLNTRMRKQTGQLENPHLLKTLRRDVARMETILHQKRNVETTA